MPLLIFATAKPVSQFRKFAQGEGYIEVNTSTNQEAQKGLMNKPAWRSSIWMSINVIFTPATANGYSHNALSPFAYKGAPRRISAQKVPHWDEWKAKHIKI